MSALERRYRRLLRAYPGWYLADRGEEILGTVLEADTRGRSWPSAREAKTLIIGGLRVRAGQGERVGLAASLRQVGLFAAMLILGPYAAMGLATFDDRWGGDPFIPIPGTWTGAVTGLLTLIVMIAVWSRWRAAARVVALVTAGLWVYQPPGSEAGAIAPVLALVLTAILASGGMRLPRLWLWLVAVLFVARELSYIATAAEWPYLIAFYAIVIYAIIVGAIAFAVVDARPMAAVAMWLTLAYSTLVIQALFQLRPELYYWALALAIISIAVSIATVWRLRRQAAL